MTSAAAKVGVGGTLEGTLKSTGHFPKPTAGKTKAGNPSASLRGSSLTFIVKLASSIEQVAGTTSVTEP